MNSLRIGFFTDVHLREHVPGTSSSPKRISRRMAKRLQECVEEFRKQKVDIIACTGDIIDDQTKPNMPEDLALIRNILDEIDVPKIMIPGNHDPYPGMFYEVFEEPQFLRVVNNYQLLSLTDWCKPGKSDSRRSEQHLKRMQADLNYKPKDIEASLIFQHYLIYPEGLKGYPYNYINAAEIRGVMEKSQTKVISIHGHYHKGIEPTIHNGVTYFAGKAMCEHPYPFYILDIRGKEMSVKKIVSDEPAPIL